MKLFVGLRRWIVGLMLVLGAPWAAAIELIPVVSGLASPLLATHAGDGSRRLFIVEKGGAIKVLQPGAQSTTTFLDIRTRLALGGSEQGLLGLAFHPQYTANGRFFVFYTRTGDGALTIAEYRVSADPNVAGTAETVLLVIPHPGQTNHNGGMLAFGPDGFLHIGVGDGGGGNDPTNNAQNVQVLLGKMLRIDVDRPDTTAGTPYSSPADNPYVGVAGRDEIFSIGWRNPWRFSFDRGTGQAWVADVGQGAREEVDSPVVKGGNYGWRVYEGSQCTGLDPSLCTPANFVAPRFEYSHSAGRCSITGGHVYRGSQGSLPLGGYVFGDYCTGEIFLWDGSTQSVLRDTTLNISAFGEDEDGEIYVVGLGGTVSRIAPTVPCTFSISPNGQSVAAAGGSGTVAVTAGAGCGWTAVANDAWIQVTGGATGSGNGSVAFSVAANTTAQSRTGTITIAGQTFTLTQDPAVACSYTLTPRRANYPAGGGGGSVTVSAPVGCAWTATPSVPWLAISGAAGGSGNGTVTYTVAPNSGRFGRTGTIGIAGRSLLVIQSR